MSHEKEPTITESDRDATTHHHDAYGTVTLTTVVGGAPALFGSDLGHHQRIRIAVSRADLTRDLNRDRVHSRDLLLEFEMSHAQFAQFITSTGNGTGTPVTLKYAPAPGTVLADMPEIKKHETKHETFRREIGAASRKALEDLQAQIEQLGTMVESGKTGKKDLRDLHHTLKCLADNLPSSMEWVVKSAEKALEQATNDAKVEVEAYVDATARRIGLESIAQLGQPENKDRPAIGS